jgi:hypothetical protein
MVQRYFSIRPIAIHRWLLLTVELQTGISAAHMLSLAAMFAANVGIRKRSLDA